MAHWFVDAEIGDDSFSGNSPLTAKRTLAAIQSGIGASEIVSGDVVNLSGRFRSEYLIIGGITGLTTQQTPGRPMARLDYGNFFPTAWTSLGGGVFSNAVPSGGPHVPECWLTDNYDASRDSEGHTRAFMRRVASLPLTEDGTYHVDAGLVTARPASGDADLIEYIVQNNNPILANDAIECVIDFRGIDGVGESFSGAPGIPITRGIRAETSGTARYYSLRAERIQSTRIYGIDIIDGTHAHGFGFNVRSRDNLVDGLRWFGKHSGGDLGAGGNHIVIAGQGPTYAGEDYLTVRNTFRNVYISTAPLMRHDGSQGFVLSGAGSGDFIRVHAGTGDPEAEIGPGPGSLRLEDGVFRAHSLYPRTSFGLLNTDSNIPTTTPEDSPVNPGITQPFEQYAQQMVRCRFDRNLGRMGNTRGSVALDLCVFDRSLDGASGQVIGDSTIARPDVGIFLRRCLIRTANPILAPDAATNDGARLWSGWPATGTARCVFRREKCTIILDQPASVGTTATQRARNALFFRDMGTDSKPPVFIKESRNHFIVRGHNSGVQSTYMLSATGASWHIPEVSVESDGNLWYGLGGPGAAPHGNRANTFGGGRFGSCGSGSAFMVFDTEFAPGGRFAADKVFCSDRNDFGALPMTDLKFIDTRTGAPFDVFDPEAELEFLGIADDSPLHTVAADVEELEAFDGMVGLNGRLMAGGYGAFGFGPLAGWNAKPLPAPVPAVLVRAIAESVEVAIQTTDDPNNEHRGLIITPAMGPVRLRGPSPGGRGQIRAVLVRDQFAEEAISVVEQWG